MTREELIEGVVSRFKKSRLCAGKKRGEQDKKTVTFLMRARQERRAAQLADKKVKLQSASKGMKRSLRVRVKGGGR